MIDLKNVDLLSLQTSYMKKDFTTKALCAALTPQFRQLANETKLCLIYSRVNELDEEALDELAWQMHVDYYDATVAIEVKRELVKNSLKWHKKKGTAGVVKEVIAAVFGRSWIEEWYQYGGYDFHFKVNVEASQQGASQADLIKLESLIDEYKNERSFLEKINIFLASLGTFFVASTLNCGEQITVYPWSITEVSGSGMMRIGPGYQAVETTTVYPL